MKKVIKRFALGDKVFFIGFSLLTVATFDFSVHWAAITLLGVGYFVWRVVYAARG